MHDIKFIRNHPEKFQKLMKRRGLNIKSSFILEIDTSIRGYQTEIQTNTGTGKIRKEGEVPEFTTVMFSEKLITNLLALNEVCERYHVTFNSRLENAFK